MRVVEGPVISCATGTPAQKAVGPCPTMNSHSDHSALVVDLTRGSAAMPPVATVRSADPVPPSPSPPPASNAAPAPALPSVAESIPLYRYWNQTNSDHYYTIERNDEGLAAFGYTFERIEGQVFATQLPQTVPLYRFWNPTVGDHFYSVVKSQGDTAPGYVFERIEAYVFADAQPGTVALYRYVSDSDHFYATDYAPNGVFGYHYERVAAYFYP